MRRMRIFILTAGRPCGPCKGGSRFMLLRNACLVVAVVELFFGAVVMSASLGALTSIYFGYDDLPQSKDEKNLRCFCFIWQASTHFLNICVAFVALLAFLHRRAILCPIYIGGILVVTILSSIGLLFSFKLIPSYYIIIGIIGLRIYFAWIMTAYYVEIKTYPEGFPPQPRPMIEPQKLPSPLPTRESSIHYVGDG